MEEEEYRVSLSTKVNTKDNGPEMFIHYTKGFRKVMVPDLFQGLKENQHVDKNGRNNKIIRDAIPTW